ncbi:hypothetical protein phiA019_0152 [Aeromonas phage phiA019]|nr:hypothetical protein phiA009_0155 [Aeromonas phage phiA009]ULG01688.1 hypothetical protein phiA019_0152 [Aeromonas phage phiA019]
MLIFSKNWFVTYVSFVVTLFGLKVFNLVTLTWFTTLLPVTIPITLLLVFFMCLVMMKCLFKSSYEQFKNKIDQLKSKYKV